MNNRNGKMILVIVLILLAAAAAVGGGIGVSRMRNRRIYNENIESGDKYLAAGDYDNAILMYQNAISLNDKEDAGYIKLAGAYKGQGYLALAIGSLEAGYDKTKSDRIQELLIEYRNLANSGGGGEQKDPLLNTTLLGKISSSSYGDYVARNEVTSVQMSTTGEAIVRVRGISADLIFRNTQLLPNIVVGTEITPTAFPSEVRFDNLIGLVGVNGTLSLAQLQTLQFDDVQLITSGTGYQLQLVYLGSSILVPCDKDGNVVTTTPCVMEPEITAQATGSSQSAVVLQGYVEDAQTGSGIAGASVKIYEGSSTVNDPVADLVTDEFGKYSAQLESGQYKAVIRKDGYTEIEKDVYVGSYSAEQQENFVMSSEDAGQIRLVLEWNSSECDLDSYLFGGDSVMKFSNRESYAGGELAAALDRDSRSGPGVETTTIYDMNGSYEFEVFDYMESGGMQSSGATVTIYVPGESPQTVSITSEEGNTWHVCTINAGKVSITNYMSTEQATPTAK